MTCASHLREYSEPITRHTHVHLCKCLISFIGQICEWGLALRHRALHHHAHIADICMGGVDDAPRDWMDFGAHSHGWNRIVAATYLLGRPMRPFQSVLLWFCLMIVAMGMLDERKIRFDRLYRDTSDVTTVPQRTCTREFD